MAADWLPQKSIRACKRLLQLYIYKLLVVACLSFVLSCQQGARDLAPGRAINSFSVKNLEGKEADLKDYFGSNTTVIAFLASWCESCKSELPWLSKLNKHLSSYSGRVIAVALDDNLIDLQKLKQDYQIDFEILLDSQAKSRQYFKLTGFPEYLILDKNFAPKLIQTDSGTLNLKLIGPQNWNRLFPGL